MLVITALSLNMERWSLDASRDGTTSWKVPEQSTVNFAPVAELVYLYLIAVSVAGYTDILQSAPTRVFRPSNCLSVFITRLG